MALYHGGKSLDAEICIDLKTNKIVMDYSLNAVASPYESNTSAVLKDDFKKLPRTEKIKHFAVQIPVFAFFLAYMTVTVPLITTAYKYNLIKNHEYQLEHQRLMRDLFINGIHSYVDVYEGPLDSKTLTFMIPNNLWVHYTLEGDYNTELIAVNLKRNFVHRKKFGIYDQVIQRGWKVVFDFENIPQSGKCTLTST